MQFQVIQATHQAPHIIAQFPMYYGAYCPHSFWTSSSPATKNRPTQELIFSSCWNNITKTWATPKVKSLPFSIVSLLLISTDPSDVQCGLPIFACLQRPTSKDQVPEYLPKLLEFGTTYSNHLNTNQRQRLMEHLLTISHSTCETYQALNSMWHYQPPAIQPPPMQFSGDQE